MAALASTVSIIIVNYNGQRLLGELFESIAQQTHPPAEVIMVDNASVDDSVEYVRENFSWVKIVTSDENTGFAGGNNLGLLHSSGDYIALLNSDTVVDKRWLAELLMALDQDESIGAAVSKIHIAASKPTIDCAGAEFNNLGFAWGRGANEPDTGQFDKAMPVPALTACAALIRRSALGNAPLFDSKLFMYYEEFDLALRLRGSGYNIFYVPRSIVYHKRSEAVKTVNRPFLFHQFYSHRNRIKILAKYYPLSVLVRNLPLILLSLIYCDWVLLRKGGPVFFLRAVTAQIRYAAQGIGERLHGRSVDSRQWLPWMTTHGLRDILALKTKLGTYVQ
ncbi:MAG TPA: glycosyltransferase family 2 protein [Pyrinomonadaceae bacterium]|nr:glycosyltransferase family 2 protein [Pyrinomonadaceae bacterium]